MRYFFILWVVGVSCQARQDARPAPKASATEAPAIQQPPPPKALPKTEPASASMPTRAKLVTTKKTLKELLAISPDVTANWVVTAERRLVFAFHLLGVSDFNPIVFMREGASWSATTFSDDLHGHGWQSAVYVPQTKTVIAVLDFEVESSGPQLEILSSQDGGETWSQSTIEKPYYLSQFLQLEAFSDGAARISVILEDDYGSGVKPGLYQYVSKDGGATWSPPSFSSALPGVSPASSLSTNIKAEGDLDTLSP